MADVTTVGNLTNTATTLDGTEYFPVEQGGVLKKMQSSVLLADVNSQLASSKDQTYFYIGVI